VKAPVRVPLKLAIDGDVAGVADLLRQIRGVEDELRPEVSTPERSCIGSPERICINDSGKKAPELGAFS